MIAKRHTSGILPFACEISDSMKSPRKKAAKRFKILQNVSPISAETCVDRLCNRYGVNVRFTNAVKCDNILSIGSAASILLRSIVHFSPQARRDFTLGNCEITN